MKKQCKNHKVKLTSVLIFEKKGTDVWEALTYQDGALVMWHKRDSRLRSGSEYLSNLSLINLFLLMFRSQ